MNGPQSFPQPGAPIMPNKHETAPKWSEEEMRLAEQFVLIGHTVKGDFITKRNTVAIELAKANLNGFPGSTMVQSYMDLPAGVRSAVSHLASEAAKVRKQEREAVEQRELLEYEAEQRARLLREATQEWLAKYGGEDGLSPSQTRFRKEHPLNPDLDPQDIIDGIVRET